MPRGIVYWLAPRDGGLISGPLAPGLGPIDVLAAFNETDVPPSSMHRVLPETSLSVLVECTSEISPWKWAVNYRWRASKYARPVSWVGRRIGLFGNGTLIAYLDIEEVDDSV